MAIVDDADFIAHLLGLFEVVGRQDDRHALFVQTADIGPEHVAQLDIDACGRFIKDKDLGAVDQRLAKQESTAHPARKRAGIGLGLIRKADQFKDIFGFALGFRHAVEARLYVQCAARGEERIEVQFLWHDADGRAGLARVHVLIEPPDFHRPLGFDHQTGENIDQCGLARTVRSQETKDRTRRDVEVDAAQGVFGRLVPCGAVGFAQVADFDRVLGHVVPFWPCPCGGTWYHAP